MLANLGNIAWGLFLGAALGWGLWMMLREVATWPRRTKTAPKPIEFVFRDIELRGGTRSGMVCSFAEPLPAVIQVPFVVNHFIPEFGLERYLRTDYMAGGRLVYREEQEAAAVDGVCREVRP